jgi:hypothetical protein
MQMFFRPLGALHDLRNSFLVFRRTHGVPKMSKGGFRTPPLARLGTNSSLRLH